MSEVKKRQVHTPDFKAKVGLEVLRGMKTINEIGQEHGVHPVQVGQWKKAIQEQAKTLFEGKRGPKPIIPVLWWCALVPIALTISARTFGILVAASRVARGQVEKVGA